MTTIPDNLLQAIQSIAKHQNIEIALKRLLTEALESKIDHWQRINHAFEQKWQMTFEHFEQQSAQMPEAHTWEMDKTYMDWEAASQELQYLHKLKEAWTEQGFYQN